MQVLERRVLKIRLAGLAVGVLLPQPERDAGAPAQVLARQLKYARAAFKVLDEDNNTERSAPVPPLH